MIERAFGESPWTVGVEEELFLVDRETLELVPAAARVLAHGIEGVKAELLECVVETTTGICRDAAEAGERLRRLRALAAGAAEAEGLLVLASGSHPFAIPEEQSITPEPHYLAFVDAAGPAARRQLVSGLHVHVGMPDAETCFRAHEAALPWLPLVLALSANSPWFRGERSGFASKRAEVMLTLPRAAVPPPLSSYAEWEALMERWIAAGVVERPTATWWDARLHPALGTLELRAPDQPTDPDVATAFVALLHALAVHGARSDPPPASRAEYGSNRFFAARFGTEAQLLHPFADRLASVTELLDVLLETIDPVVAELGVAPLLEPLRPPRCEALRQLEHEDPHAAAADLVGRSLASRA